MDILNARVPVFVTFVFQISVCEGYEPPEHREEDPTAEEPHREHQKIPPPLNVHHGGEDVLQVALAALGNVLASNVHCTILQDHPLPLPPVQNAGVAESGRQVFPLLGIPVKAHVARDGGTFRESSIGTQDAVLGWRRRIVFNVQFVVLAWQQLPYHTVFRVSHTFHFGRR
ncbi:hypothetical protein AVEN_116871-1 [Araneus ventricosus]|uniref:Secreted protein n=1 Tax=Araneus ventricosus TaxID=182803 RepID=A0A4Y2R2R3_ARAVE|nr:hypothetical protein AVEN_216146-1 [Araneus ventricosus]GBN69898.1 hypothetical protein AVEN_116871-1 [Araneus ventricosus]